jgi:Glycosyl hydrolases family 2, TIM barrel domain/Glycosyl hydrolases family 2, sugar binding domain/Glycosyl hydrolases family 2
VLVRSVLLSVVLVLSAAGVARTQGALYPAQPPTKTVLYADGQTDRWLLGGTWLYRADLGDVGVADGWWRDDADTSEWAAVTVPNSYNAGNFSSQSQGGYVGWYRRDFTLPRDAFGPWVPPAARHWIIRFESVNYFATVWLNGREIGTHAGAYLPFELDLTGLHAGVNRLIVRVDDRTNPGDLPPGPGSNWWNFGGLQREVYLRAVGRADLQQLQVRPLLRCRSCAATIDEQAVVRNVTGTPQTVQLRGTYGGVPVDFGHATIGPHGTWTPRASAVIAHPRLWAPGSPYLYRSTVTLLDAGGRPLGGYSTNSGIRTIKVTPGGRMELNGRLLNLRGFDLHVQNITTGAALTQAQYAQLIAWVRESGAMIIRAHYPVGPQLEELADRYGILIWSEIPAWEIQNQYLSQPRWRAHTYEVLRENILDNQNHPSVLLWSIGNELPTRATAGDAAYIAGASALARRLDPTRPVGLAISNPPGTPCQSAYAPLDAIGDNEYFGYSDNAGGANDDRDALGPFLDTVRACYPTKALFISEFGFDADRDGPVEERGTYAFQANSVAFNLGVFASKHWLSGALYFTLQEYAAYPGYSGGDPWPNPPFNQKGLVDLYGNFKPAWSVVSSVYHATTQIAPAGAR